MMPESWRQTFLIHSTTPEYRRAVKRSEGMIRAALDRHARMYCAYSGGKDSIVMTWLVLQQAPETMVWHWDYGRRFMPRSIEDEVNRNAATLGATTYEIVTSELYDTDYDGKIFIPHLFRREFPRLVEAGYDGVFVGIRAQESRKRARRIAANESIGPIRETWPVAHWTWRDIWACIVANNLPYPAIYDERSALLGYDQSRMCTFFDPEFDTVGSTTVDGILHWRMRGPH